VRLGLQAGHAAAQGPKGSSAKQSWKSFKLGSFKLAKASSWKSQSWKSRSWKSQSWKSRRWKASSWQKLQAGKQLHRALLRRVGAFGYC
jgi:hypothetical protein